MELKKQISEQLHSNRPNLSANSVKTYTSLLFNIQKKLNKKVNSMEWYANSEDVIIQSLDAANRLVLDQNKSEAKSKITK